mmetsp:Transcript_17925/g.44093  ORF Transcript_17925/g.44093 Transcript_17925/m.44093 type:complete len:307 (-) Transcript_17925:843-1763(-)
MRLRTSGITKKRRTDAIAVYTHTPTMLVVTLTPGMSARLAVINKLNALATTKPAAVLASLTKCEYISSVAVSNKKSSFTSSSSSSSSRVSSWSAAVAFASASSLCFSVRRSYHVMKHSSMHSATVNTSSMTRKKMSSGMGSWSIVFALVASPYGICRNVSTTASRNEMAAAYVATLVANVFASDTVLLSMTLASTRARSFLLPRHSRLTWLKLIRWTVNSTTTATRATTATYAHRKRKLVCKRRACAPLPLGAAKPRIAGPADVTSEIVTALETASAVSHASAASTMLAIFLNVSWRTIWRSAVSW